MITTFDQPEALAFRDEIKGWLAKAVRPEWHEQMFVTEEHPQMLEIRREWDQALWDAGYAGLAWPVEYGGRGLGPVEEVIFFEESAAAHAPQELNLLGLRLAGPAIVRHGTDAQKEKHLRAILSGEEMWCEGFSEPNAGSDMASVSTTGRRLPGGGWHVVGQKIWTTFAPLADRCYLLTRTSDGPRRHNLSVFMLDMHAPGVEVRPIAQLTGVEGFGEVFIDADVPDSDMLGAEGEGWMLSSLVGAHRTAGAALGAIQRWSDLRMLVDHLQAGCGARLGADRIEALADEVEVLRWQIRRAVELAMSGSAAPGPGAVLKLAWSQLAQAVTQCGVDAACPEHERFWRDTHFDFRKLTIAGGTSQLQRNVLAERVLGLPR